MSLGFQEKQYEQGCTRPQEMIRTFYSPHLLSLSLPATHSAVPDWLYLRRCRGTTEPTSFRRGARTELQEAFLHLLVLGSPVTEFRGRKQLSQLQCQLCWEGSMSKHMAGAGDMMMKGSFET